MKHKTCAEVFYETAKMHDLTRTDPTLSKDQRQNNWLIIEQSYNWCLEQQPNEPLLVGALAAWSLDTGRIGNAIALFDWMTKVTPSDPQIWNGLGVSYRKAQRMPQARIALKRAIDLDPKNPDHYSNMGGTYINENEPQRAIDWFDKALKIKPDHRDAKFNQGLALLETGDFKRGFEGYEMARKLAGWRERVYNGPGGEIPAWDGKPVDTLLVYGEQGVGDEVIFSTCMNEAIEKNGHVIIDCHPRLYNLFKASFPTATVYGTRKQDAVTWPAKHKIDARVAMGSLPYFFRTRREDFPKSCNFIVPDPAQVENYQGNGDKLRVGISWIGGTKDTRIEERSIEPKRLGSILTVPGIEWVSLQYTNNASEQVDEMRKLFDCDISHDDAANADLDKLFGLIYGLDLVVSVLTSNIHFAGSMGKEVAILAPIKCPWQFALKDVPWYPQHKIYRQTQSGDWESVLSRLAGDLKTKALAHHGRLPRAEPVDAQQRQVWGG